MKTEFELTPDTMRGHCPNCDADWRGDSFYEVYRQEYINQKIDIDNDETLQEALRENLAKHYKQTHQSRLINVINSKINLYICPDCGSTFNLKNELP